MRSFIIGSDGQDGIILNKILTEQNDTPLNLNRKGIFYQQKFLIKTSDLTSNKLLRIFREYKIDKIYFLAAQSSPTRSNLDTSSDPLINILTLILRTIADSNSAFKFFFASSSLIFANCKITPQNESTEIAPLEKYALDKVIFTDLLVNFSNSFNNFALYIGIFYNHDSIYRKKGFFTRHVIETAIQNYVDPSIKKQIDIYKPISVIDISHAYDFMQNLFYLVNYCNPGTYIFSSAKETNILDFIIDVFTILNLNYEKYCIISQADSHFLRSGVSLIGDNSKLIKELGKLYIESDQKLSRRLTLEWMNKYGIL